MSNFYIDELRRLRDDFEREASQYHPLTLTVYYLTQEELGTGLPIPQPHHGITLWQFVGDGQEILAKMKRPTVTKFGLPFAELTALAVLAGDQVELFRRMAARAASLIPDEARELLSVGIVEQIGLILNQVGSEQDLPEEKFIYTSNPNPLAVWLNMMLATNAAFQPERVRGGQLAVDPFTGSLGTIDVLLERLSKQKAEPKTDGTAPGSEQILEIKPGIAGISINLRALIRWLRRWWSQRGERATNKK